MSETQAEIDNELSEGEVDAQAQADNNEELPQAGDAVETEQGETAEVEDPPLVVIEPTVGRVVYLFEGTKATPRAAIIAGFDPKGRVNLGAFDHDGSRIAMSGVPFVQAHEDKPTEGWWATWMPYQVGQAAKTENVEAALEDRIEQLETDVEELASHCGL